jgi:hypothetical protein
MENGSVASYSDAVVDDLFRSVRGAVRAMMDN